MEVDRKALTTLLNGIKPAIATTGDEDMQKKIVFTGKDAVAYSETMCIVWPFETDFRTVAPSDELMQLLNRVSADTVNLIYSKDCINIKTTNVKARIKTEPKSPILDEVDALLASTETDWWQLPGQFREAVKLCMYAVSKDSTQRSLMCVYASGPDIVASDDFRISHYKMEEVFGHTALINQSACVEIARHPVTTYAVTDSWLLFNTDDNILIAARAVAEDYGDITPFFEFEGTEYELPKKVKDHIDTVSVMAEGEFDILKEITVDMSTGKIVLTGERDLGWVKAEINDKTFNIEADVAFSINPDFFKEILDRTTTMKLGEDKGLFEKDNFRHLIGLTLR